MIQDYQLRQLYLIRTFKSQLLDMETWLIISIVVVVIKLFVVLIYLWCRAMNNQKSRQRFHNEEVEINRSANAALSRIQRQDHDFEHVQDFQPEPNRSYEPPPTYWSVVQENPRPSAPIEDANNQKY